MTPDELRLLADEATAEPWRFENNEVVNTGGGGFRIELSRTQADARLIALAPDLARLCAEFAEVAEQIIRCGDRKELRAFAEAARYDLAVPLARLSELEP